MVAATSLHDIDAALWAWLCAHVLDGILRLIVLVLLDTVAGARVPRAGARQAELVLAVWAGSLVTTPILSISLCLVLGARSLVFVIAVLDGEVGAALWVQASNVQRIDSEKVLGQGSIPTVYVSSCLTLHRLDTYVSKRADDMTIFSCL